MVKLFNFFSLIKKYIGLQYPGLVNFYDKNQLETKENELTEHFYREMRKPPSQ